MKTSEKTDLIIPAYVAFQAEVKHIKADSDNPFYRSKYADLDAVWSAARPLLAKHGLAVIQSPAGLNIDVYPSTWTKFDKHGKEYNESVPMSYIGLEQIIMHTSGQWIEFSPFVYACVADPQKMAACLTYAKRTGLASILSIVTNDEDDDGETASAPVRQAPARQAPAPKATKRIADATKSGGGNKYAEDMTAKLVAVYEAAGKPDNFWSEISASDKYPLKSKADLDKKIAIYEEKGWKMGFFKPFLEAAQELYGPAEGGDAEFDPGVPNDGPIGENIPF